MTMRTISAAALTAMAVILATANARADVVPPFKGNDTGGIVSASLWGQTDVRGLAASHCAQYGKVVKWLSIQRTYGNYSSFACRWVPIGRYDRPLRVRY